MEAFIAQARNFFRRHGWRGTVRLCAYPLTLLMTNPWQLLRTLWRCRVLAGPGRGEYNRFTATAGLNSLTYRTCAMVLERHGQSGYSPVTGMGDYRLARWFYFPMLGLRLYARQPCLTPPLAMLLWLVFHLAWLPGTTLGWWLVVVSTAALSTWFYENAFSVQNYNVVGWMFMPLGIYAMYHGQWWLAAAAWLATVCGSFTVAVISCWFALWQSVATGTPWPVLALLPTGLLLCAQVILPHVRHGGIARSLREVADMIGLGSQRQVMYRRVASKRFSRNDWYHLALVIQFIAVAYAHGGDIGMMAFAALLWVINGNFARFADTQSMHMLALSMGTATMFTLDAGLWAWCSFWLMVSPLPVSCLLPWWVFDRLPVVEPFHVEPILRGMREFLASAASARRIVVAYPSPEGIYEKVFAGQAVLQEAGAYVAAQQGMHWFPDWWAVYEHAEQPERRLWGDTPAAVAQLLRDWNTKFAVVSTTAQSELSPEWSRCGFVVLARFSWSQWREHLRGEIMPPEMLPDWHLVRYDGREPNARFAATGVA